MKGNFTPHAAMYLHAGLCALPAKLKGKHPALPGWRKFQKRRPTHEEIDQWFAPSSRYDAICIVCGEVSGNLEAIDFDQQGRAFEKWRELVESEQPGLVERLVIQKTQSGGFHVLYCCPSGVEPMQKLAMDRSKKVLIETRGEGGLVLCAPSPRYEVVQGNFAEIPSISADERETLLVCARMLDERPLEIVDGPRPPADRSALDGLRPGDDFNLRGDIGPLLERHGWRRSVTRGANEHWTRPGKDSGTSATFNGMTFYLFSTNASQFERTGPFDKFGVFARLEHSGDLAAATRDLREQGYGHDPQPTVVYSAIEDGSTTVTGDADRVPESLLRVPGFISEVMDYTLETAPYPNPTLAFCGAISLLAFLGGQRFCDEAGTRTNLYLIALANSGAGKERPRQVNARILHEIGLESCLGDAFASGQGLEDALSEDPVMLFQTDEIDTLLSAIGRARDDRYEALVGALLKFNTSASTIVPVRKKAGTGRGKSIVQPCLVLFGTAIPAHFYAAASERLLTNGLFGRTIIFEAGKRGNGQTPRQLPLPSRVVEAAQMMKSARPGSHRGGVWTPDPQTVQADPGAKRVYIEHREKWDDLYSKADIRNDPIETALRARTLEHAHRLGLLYAISESPMSPCVTENAAEWSCEVAELQVARMLTMADRYSGANPFEADCQFVSRKLAAAPGRTMPHWLLLKRTKFSADRLNVVISTLIDRREVNVLTSSTGGRESRVYVLVES